MAMFPSIPAEHEHHDGELPVGVIAANKLYDKIISNENGVIFFCGAGFSKAWDNNYPTGLALFAIENSSDSDENFFKFATDMEIQKPTDNGDEQQYNEDCYRYFREVKFHLDSYKRYPSLMPSYIDSTIISALESEIRGYIKARFVTMVGQAELDVDLDIDNAFTRFFAQMFAQSSSAISFITTNYDFIIEKILRNSAQDISLNRGVVDKKQFAAKKWHKDKVNLFKLNGGFEVSSDSQGSFIDYDGHHEHLDNIILPSPQQNYNDPYFDSVFVKSAAKLREANLLIFVGYSLPEEDHTIRFLLKNFNDSSNTEKEIVVIDYGEQNAMDVARKAQDVFPSLAEKEAIFALKGNLSDLLEQI